MQFPGRPRGLAQPRPLPKPSSPSPSASALGAPRSKGLPPPHKDARRATPPRPARRRPGRACPPPAPAPPAAAGPPPPLRVSPGPRSPRLTSLGTSWFSSLGTMAGGAALGPRQAEPSVVAVVSSRRRRDAAGSSSFAATPADEGFHPLRQRQSMRKRPTSALSRELESPASAHRGPGGSRRWCGRVGGVRRLAGWRFLVAVFTQSLTESGARPVAVHNLHGKPKGRARPEFPLRSETSQSSLSVGARTENIVCEEAAVFPFSALLALGAGVNCPSQSSNAREKVAKD